LVPFIEEGEIKGKLIEALVAKYLARFNKSQVDVLILGCTHYPIIAGLISRQVGKKITLVNPETAVVKDIIAYLKKKEMLAPFNQRPEFKYFVTDLTERFTRVAEMFLGERLKGSLKKVILS
jgi:glutamate racemase